MLIVTNLDKSFDGNLIFKNLSFSVQDGDKVAVVGLNGAGKSTLFRILLNQIDCDSGEFYMGKNPRVGWMPQTIDELNLPEDVIVYDFLRSGRPLAEIEQRMTEIYSKMADGDESEELLQQLGIDRMLMLPSGRLQFYDENIVRRYMEQEKHINNI